MKWIDDVEKALRDGFQSIEREEDLPGQALADSAYWARAMFTRGNGPYEPSARVRRWVHRATESIPDLVRHEYDTAGLHLAVTEGRSFAFVVVSGPDADLSERSEDEKRAIISRIAQALFHPACTQGGACFRFPERIEEGSMFSTNPDADPRLLAAWTDRLDAGVRGGALYFLLYKRLPWLTGWRDAFSWLRDDSRPLRATGRKRRLRRRS